MSSDYQSALLFLLTQCSSVAELHNALVEVDASGELVARLAVHCVARWQLKQWAALETQRSRELLPLLCAALALAAYRVDRPVAGEAIASPVPTGRHPATVHEVPAAHLQAARLHIASHAVHTVEASAFSSDFVRAATYEKWLRARRGREGQADAAGLRGLVAAIVLPGVEAPLRLRLTRRSNVSVSDSVSVARVVRGDWRKII